MPKETLKNGVNKDLMNGFRKFIDNYRKGELLIVEAAKQYVHDMSVFGAAGQKYYDEQTGNCFGKHDWKILAAIGTGMANPRTWGLKNPLMTETVMALPLDVQNRYLGTGEHAGEEIKCFSRGKTISKRIEYLSASEMNACIDRKAGRVRSILEQIEAYKTKNEAKEKLAEAEFIAHGKGRWELTEDGTVHVLSEAFLTPSDVESMYRYIMATMVTV